MRRLARLLFTILAALSLLLCVAVCVVWVRSYWVVDGLTHACEGRQSGVWSTGGRIMVDTMGNLSVPRWPGFHGWQHISERQSSQIDFIDHPSVPRRQFLGVKVARVVGQVGFAPGEIAAVTVPYWIILLPTCVFPVIRFRQLAQRRRCRKLNLCVNCGYDLRASPERCPECGTIAAMNAEL